VGISPSEWLRFESGGKVPKLDVAKHMAQKLERDEDDLFPVTPRAPGRTVGS